MKYKLIVMTSEGTIYPIVETEGRIVDEFPVLREKEQNGLLDEESFAKFEEIFWEKYEQQIPSKKADSRLIGWDLLKE